jgi:hypothetical protein
MFRICLALPRNAHVIFSFPRRVKVTRFRFQSSTFKLNLSLNVNSRYIPREPRNLRYTKLHSRFAGTNAVVLEENDSEFRLTAIYSN